MSATLHLTIATPDAVLVNAAPVLSLRAEDDTGSFGVLAGHADFLTVLTPSVLRWHGEDQVPHFCAVSEGVLRVSEGNLIAIACRDAVLGDALEALESTVRTARQNRLDVLRQARVEQTRLQAQAVRQLLRFLRPGNTMNVDSLADTQELL